jgi:hypothetical protein
MATVSVLKTLVSNACPLCGRYHKYGSGPAIRHMKELYALGYSGYDYDTEQWVVD